MSEAIEWGLFVFLRLLSVLAVFRFVPEHRRRKYALYKKQPGLILARVLFASIWIISAIQSWIHPIGLSETLRWETARAGVTLILLGEALFILAFRQNPFFVPAIVYVPRNLRVTDGVYRLRHPGYFGCAFSAIGSWFLIGQSWAFLPLLFYLIFLGCRVWKENRLLRSP